MRILVWLIRGFFFFALFAFALNNRQEVVVHWFFGRTWNAPLVFVVFAVFAAGAALGILAMTPAWWRRRTVAERKAQGQASSVAITPNEAPAPLAPREMALPAHLAETELALTQSARQTP